MGWPAGSRAQNAFNGSLVRLADAGPLQLELPPYGVTAISSSQAR